MLKKRNLISGFLKNKVNTVNDNHSVKNFPPKSETSKLNNINQNCEEQNQDTDIISNIINTLKDDQEFIKSISILLRKELILFLKEEVEHIILKEYKDQLIKKNCELEILNSQIREKSESYLEVKSQFQKFLTNTMNNLNSSIKLLQKENDNNKNLY